MKSEIRPCPICGDESVFSRHPQPSPSTGEMVPANIYTCKKDGWFSLSDAVNNAVTKNRTTEVIEKLSAIVAKNYFPESEWPASRTAPLQPIESIE